MEKETFFIQGSFASIYQPTPDVSNLMTNWSVRFAMMSSCMK